MTGNELFNAFLDELVLGAENRSLMVMIAGPNGAGKTTLWRNMILPMLEGSLDAIYINADEIERELNQEALANKAAPQTPVTARQAQKEATRRRELLLSAAPPFQSHFVFETVFSDPYGHKLKELQRGVTAGYYVVMLFVGLTDVALAGERVKHRVSTGGHNVDPDVQQERFPRVFANARDALKIVPLACFFDNSRDRADGNGTHRPVALFKAGALIGQNDEMPTWWSTLFPPSV